MPPAAPSAAAPASTPIVALRGVAKHFANGTLALDKLGLAIRAGGPSDPARRLLGVEEQFAALDGTTLCRLTNVLLALWRAVGITGIFVDHSVFDSVSLSSRIVVMTPRPGRVFAELTIDAPYPRGESFRTSAEYAGYCRIASQALTRAMAAAA